jgi:hypothetical protein
MNAAIALVLVGVGSLGGLPLDEGLDLTNAQKGLMFGSDIFVAAGSALAQCLAFTLLGKEIDRPVWRVDGMFDALRRFYFLWFGLKLMEIAFIRVQAAAFSIWGSGGPAPFFWGLLFAMSVMIIPFGACVMFHGKMVWREIGEALLPLYRYASQVLALCLASLAILFLLLFIPAELDFNKWLDPGLEALYGVWECVVFIGVWLICITHRETPHENNDFDF